MTVTHWTYVKGKVIIHFADGTHSPKFDSDKEANEWLQENSTGSHSTTEAGQ